MKPKQVLKNPDFLSKLNAYEPYAKNKKRFKMGSIIFGGLFGILCLLVLIGSPSAGFVLIIVGAAFGLPVYFGSLYLMKKAYVDDYTLSLAAWNYKQSFRSFMDKPGAFDIYTSPNGEQFNPGLVVDNGIYAGIGSDRKATKIIAGNGLTTYQYQYTTGSGKNRRVNNIAVSVQTLSRSMPHMLFDAKQNNASMFGKGFTNLPTSIDKDQQIDAGVLSQHFNVYAPNSYDIDLLSVITPEIVEAMIAHSKNSDIEIIDNKLVIYNTGELKSESYPTLYAQIYNIGAEVEDNLRSYRDQRVTTLTQRTGIAEEGLRLQKSIYAQVGGVLAAILFGGLGIAGEAESTGIAVFTLIATAVATPPALIYAKVKTSKRREQNKEIQRQRALQQQAGGDPNTEPQISD